MEALSKDELLGVLYHARAARERDWLIFVLAYNHGLRIGEVLALTRDSIADSFLDVPRSKHSKRTIQPLIVHENMLLSEHQPVIDYASQMHGNQRLFNIGKRQAERLFVRYCVAAGVPRHKAHPHVLKHTCAMQIIHSAGIENTRQWLGHKSMSSTGEYLKVTDVEAARAVTVALRD